MTGHGTRVFAPSSTFNAARRPGSAHRIDALLDRCGFQANPFFVMDGSKRSRTATLLHPPGARSASFLDTLLTSLTPPAGRVRSAHSWPTFVRHVPQRLVVARSSVLPASPARWRRCSRGFIPVWLTVASAAVRAVCGSYSRTPVFTWLISRCFASTVRAGMNSRPTRSPRNTAMHRRWPTRW